MEFSKKDLLSLVKENINETPMDFDTQDRPSREIERTLSHGDTPLKKIPLPKTGEEPNKNFQELLASERYKQVVNRFREYTGIETPLIGDNIPNLKPLANMMMGAHNYIVQTENAHREELEKLAIELVMREMSIPEGALQFDAKIVGVGEIDTQDFNKEMEQEQPNIEPVDIEKDLMDDLETLNLEKAKRRLINNMIQGASKKGHYMYHYVADKIREITGSDQLINQYGILMSINDTLYWQLSDENMKAMAGGGGEVTFAGKESVERTDPPTIIVRAVNFPALVHELIKGIMEVFAIQGRPQDEEGNEEDFGDIEGSEDTLEKEVWDLRLGPAIWDRIRKVFPEEIMVDENKTELQNYLLVEIFKLPAKEFLVFMREVLSGSESGKRLMNQLLQGVDQMFKDQDYQNAVKIFQDDLEDMTDNTDDGDLDDFLGSIGIKRPDDE